MGLVSLGEDPTAEPLIFGAEKYILCTPVLGIGIGLSGMEDDVKWVYENTRSVKYAYWETATDVAESIDNLPTNTTFHHHM